MSKIIIPNREAWLQAAVERMRPMFLGHNFKVPELQVSVGWPSAGGLGTRKRTIGQCWFGETTEDKKPQLFISPLLDEVASPQGVLSTLVHEVCHVIAGSDAKHGPKFVKVMTKVGLTGKPTATEAAEDLIERMKQWAEELGAFPHSKIVPNPKLHKKQTTRLRKCECAECGYTVRTTQKWLEIGTPICPADKVPMKAMGQEDEGDE
jgi:hypothetical protein